MNDLKKIFRENRRLSDEQIEQIGKRGRSIEESKNFEKLEQQSSFEFDAVEGFSHSSLRHEDLRKLDRRMDNFLNQNLNDRSINYFTIAWFMLVSTLTLTSFFLSKTNSGKQSHNLSGKFPETEAQTNPSLEQIVNESPKPEEEIEAERFIIAGKESKKQALEPLNEENLIEKNREPILFQKLKNHTQVSLFENEPFSDIKKPWAKEVSFDEFIFVDYRGIRTSSETKTFNFSGTPADQASKKESNEEEKLKNDPNQMAYHDYLRETSGFLSSKNYFRSEQHLRIIVKTYPDDLNGNFYLGFVLFQQGKYDAALPFFKKCISHFYGNFEEEAMWYSLKCYQATGKTDGAVKIAKELIYREGFYSQQAAAFLKTLSSRNTR